MKKRYEAIKSWVPNKQVSLLSLVIFMIAVWSLVFYASWITREDMRLQMSQHEFSTVTLMAKELDHELNEHLQALEQVAGKITPAILGNAAVLQRFIEDRLAFNDVFNAGFFVTGADGTAVASLPLAEARTGINYMDRDNVAAALKEGKSSISRPVRGKVLKQPVIAMVVPIRDQRGAVIGSLVGVIDLSKPNFLDEITENQYGKSGGYLIVARQQRQIITATDKTRIMEVLPPPGVIPFIDRVIQGFEGSGVLVNPHGVEVLSSVKNIQAADWCVVLQLTTAEAFASMRSLQQHLMLVATLLTLLAMYFTLWSIKTGNANKLHKEHEKELTTKLRESNELFELYLRHSPIHTYIQEVTATESRTVLCSDSFVQMIGISAQDMIGKSMDELFPPKLAAKINSDNRDIVSSGEMFETEEELNGRYYNTIKFPIVQSGKTLLAGYTVDITERKLLEQMLRANNEKLELQVNERTEELRNSEEKYRAMINGIEGSVYICSKDYRFEFLSDKLIRQLGRNAIGEYCYKALHNLDNICEWCTADQVFQGKFSRFEHKNQSDGKWIVAHNSPIQNADGTISRQTILTDITEMKNLTEQLIYSQKMESIGKLAGGLAHDLNNILTVINGYATMLKFSMPQHDEPNQILSAATRAASLTHSLLAYSRKQEMQQSNQNLNHFMVDVGAFIQRILPENIEFAVSLADAPLFVFTDKLQIEQVMLNLATNARDAMSGGGTFSISTSLGSIDAEYIAAHGFGEIGDYAVITVADTGQGMDAATALKVFDPFFTTKEVGKGTGLGLSMVFGIVKQHGGSIDLKSEPGKGSVFSIYLPMVAGEMVVEASEKRDELLEAVAGATVLLAEDDATTRLMMAQFLKKAGYKVVSAADGQEAVDKFAAFDGEIKLVISDVMMPRKGGKAASDEIREMVKTTKFIFISGHNRDELRREDLPDSDDIIMLKPIMPFELLKKMSELLTNQ